MDTFLKMCTPNVSRHFLAEDINVVRCICSLANNHCAVLNRYNSLTWPADSVHCFDSAQSLSNSRRDASLGNVIV